MRIRLLILACLSLLLTFGTPSYGQIYGNASTVRGFATFQGTVGVGNSPLSQFRAFSEGIDNDPYVQRTLPNPLTYRAPTMPALRGSGYQQKSRTLGAKINTFQDQRIGTGKVPHTLAGLASQEPTMMNARTTATGQLYAVENRVEDLRPLNTPRRSASASYTPIAGPLSNQTLLLSKSKGLAQNNKLGQDKYTLGSARGLGRQESALTNTYLHRQGSLSGQKGLSNRTAIFR